MSASHYQQGLTTASTTHGNCAADIREWQLPVHCCLLCAFWPEAASEAAVLCVGMLPSPACGGGRASGRAPVVQQ
jgi:hypothetical protein